MASLKSPADYSPTGVNFAFDVMHSPINKRNIERSIHLCVDYYRHQWHYAFALASAISYPWVDLTKITNELVFSLNLHNIVFGRYTIQLQLYFSFNAKMPRPFSITL